MGYYSIRIAATGLALAACTSSPDRPGGVVVRDSAGVTIVTTTPANRDRLYATVESVPRVEIGAVEGDAAYELYNVTDAALTADGQIVLMNSGSRDFRIYDAEGRHIRTFGRQGEGPGELGYVQQFKISADTIIVFDVWQWRVNWFDLHGTFLRDTLVDRSNVPGTEGARLSSSTRIVAFEWGPYAPAPGLSRQAAQLVSLDLSGRDLDTVTSILSLENFHIRDQDRLRANSMPFGRDTRWAVSDVHVFVGDNSTYEIRKYRLDGTIETLIRLEVPMRPVTNADWDALTSRYREFTSERRPEDLSYVNRFLAQVPRHETQPAFGWFEVDDDGRLWVAEYDATVIPWRAERWDVFDTDGRWLGRVTLPNGIQPLAIGTDYVVGKRLDEFDVEFIGVYGLTTELSR